MIDDLLSAVPVRAYFPSESSLLESRVNGK